MDLSTNNQSQIFLHGENDYDVSAARIVIYVRLEDVQEHLVGGYFELEDEVVERTLSNKEKDIMRIHRKKDLKALHHIMNSLDTNVFPNISSSLCAKRAQEILKTNYHGVGKVQTAKLQNLRRNFEDMKMKESTIVDYFMTQVMGIFNQLNTYAVSKDYDIPTQQI